MEIIEGRECNKIELPYSKDIVWLKARLKGRDLKALRTEGEITFDSLIHFILKAQKNGEETPVGPEYIDDMDSVDIDFLAAEAAKMTSNLNSRDEDKKK